MTNKDLEKLRNKFPELPKHRPLAYKIYNYLKENAKGYDNRIKADVIMKEFEITDNKTFRGYIQEIRESSILQKIICSEAGKDGGYWVATSKDEVQDTLNHLYKRAMEMLKCYSKIKSKARLNKQMRIKMTKYEKNIIESILED